MKRTFKKNSMEFVNEIKDITVGDDEMLIPFDVVALYPSIAVEETLRPFEMWLEECNISTANMEVYIRFGKFAMRNNFFQILQTYPRYSNGCSSIRSNKENGRRANLRKIEFFISIDQILYLTGHCRIHI